MASSPNLTEARIPIQILLRHCWTQRCNAPWKKFAPSPRRICWKGVIASSATWRSFIRPSKLSLAAELQLGRLDVNDIVIRDRTQAGPAVQIDAATIRVNRW